MKTELKAEPKAGDRVLVEVEIRQVESTATPTLAFVSHGNDVTHWARIKDLIPIPPSLPAPNCAGPWLQWELGSWTAWQVFKDPGGDLYHWDASRFVRPVRTFTGTWYPIDPRLLGVEAEVEVEVEAKDKSLADEIAATDSHGACFGMLAEAIDALKAQLGEVQKLVGDNCKSVVGVMDRLDEE